jgi:transcription elongation factor SPT5
MDFDAPMPDTEEPEHIDDQMGPPPVPKDKGRAVGDDEDDEEDEDEDEDEEDEDMGRKGKKRAKVWVGLVFFCFQLTIF